MLFKVEMKVNIPHDMPADVVADIKAREKAYAQDLQEKGKWRHLWRVAGSYANVSIFDVEDNAELQDLVGNLRCSRTWISPLRPCAVTRHPFTRMTANGRNQPIPAPNVFRRHTELVAN